MKKALWFILLFGCATPSKHPTRTLVLDPGHDPQSKGTVGVKLIAEQAYNNKFTEILLKELSLNPHFKVLVTRAPEQNISLRERIDFAEAAYADLFLSIHHDSAQEKYLERIGTEPNLGWKTHKSIQGFSLFVSLENKKSEDSILLAKLVGAQLRAIQRTPSDHHAENIPGEGRKFVDQDNGVYHYDTLAVLQKTSMPAVLFEVGVIVDAADERYVSDKNNQLQMAKAIRIAVEEFFYAIGK